MKHLHWLWLTTALYAPDTGSGSGTGGGAGGGAAGGGEGNAGGGEAKPGGQLAAAAAAGAGGAQGTGQAGSGQEARSGAAATPGQSPGQAGTKERPAWAPEGLPDHMLGANEAETIEKLFTGYSGFLRANSERGAVPAEPKGYQFEASDKLKPFTAGFDADPLYQGILADMKDAGITDKQFQKIMPKMLERLVDTGGVEKPVDWSEHIAALVPDEAKMLDDKGRSAAVSRRVQDALAYLQGAKAQKAMPDDVADYLMVQLGDDHRGIKAIEHMMALGKKTGPALNGGHAGAHDAASLEARLKDPRYDPRHPSFDRAFAAETDRLYREHYQ